MRGTKDRDRCRPYCLPTGDAPPVPTEVPGDGVVFSTAATEPRGVAIEPSGLTNQHLGRFAESEIASPTPHIRGKFLHRRLYPDAFRPARDIPDSLFEPIQFGETTRLTSGPAVKLNPRNFRSCGRATALLISFTLSLSFCVMNRVMLSITR